MRGRTTKRGIWQSRSAARVLVLMMAPSCSCRRRPSELKLLVASQGCLTFGPERPSSPPLSAPAPSYAKGGTAPGVRAACLSCATTRAEDMRVNVPDTRYAKTADGLHIAYQVLGEGPIDLLFIPGYQSNLELNWDLPAYAKMLRRLASFSRLIAVDRRGT